MMGPLHILPVELLLHLGRLFILLATSALVMLALGLRLRQTMVVPAGFSTPVPDVLKTRPAAHDEVIAEFLKNEFYHSDFDEVRKEFASIVLNPNLQDNRENLRRRQLLFRKRGGLWRELPPDTTWWEVSLSSRALGRVRVFPRADWRRYSQRGFSLPQFAGRIANGLAQPAPDSFLTALSMLQRQLSKGSVGGSVLLIGIDEDKPLTIIEGNHRMVAAALMPSPPLQAFRFYCGLSPRMTHCCWYQNSVANLLHYARNVLRDLSQFRHSDLAHIFPRRRPAADASVAVAAETTLQLSGTGLQVREAQFTAKQEPRDPAA
ncbi:MAG TPA: hypothetical protein VJ756_21445 [Terriglobales bacterium]|jgi:hypothetical protein|nr:hypothetical protein [Terriglobales bacterium]